MHPFLSLFLFHRGTDRIQYPKESVEAREEGGSPEAGSAERDRSQKAVRPVALLAFLLFAGRLALF